MPEPKPKIALLLLAIVIAAGLARVLRDESADGRGTIRLAGQTGIVAELLEATGRHMSGSADASGGGDTPAGQGAAESSGPRLIDTGKNRLAFMQNSDCCAAASSWGLAARSLQGAIMCPDAARDFLAANPEFVSAGPVMLNSDVFLLRTEEVDKDGDAPTARVGIAHKRSHQRIMAESAFGGRAELAEMLPVGLTYALGKGELNAVIVDLGVAAGTGWKYVAWKGEPLATQELILRREFAQSEAFRDFARAYALARRELLLKYSDGGLRMPPLKTEF